MVAKMLFLWIGIEVKTKFGMPKSSGPKEPWSKVPFSGELSGLLFFSVIVLVWFGFWNGSNLVWLETKIKSDAVYLIPNRTLILVWDFFPHKFLNVKISVFSIFHCLHSIMKSKCIIWYDTQTDHMIIYNDHVIKFNFVLHWIWRWP